MQGGQQVIDEILREPESQKQRHLAEQYREALSKQWWSSNYLYPISSHYYSSPPTPCRRQLQNVLLYHKDYCIHFRKSSSSIINVHLNLSFRPKNLYYFIHWDFTIISIICMLPQYFTFWVYFPSYYYACQSSFNVSSSSLRMKCVLTLLHYCCVTSNALEVFVWSHLYPSSKFASSLLCCW